MTRVRGESSSLDRPRVSRPSITGIADFDHSHIVAAGYLKSWAAGKFLAMRLVGDPGRPIPVSPKDAGVRSGFTREQQPDGSYVNRLDRALARLEDKALPRLLAIDESWPPRGEERGLIAQLLAIQILRTPGWRVFYVEAIPRARESIRGDHPEAEERHFQAVEQHMLTDGHRHDRLLWQSPLLATILGSMHWTLLSTPRPRLVTCDQPVVVRGPGQIGTENANVIPPGGLANMEEVRFAVRPDLLLVGCWLDDVEDPAIRPLATHQIRNHNSIAIAQADRQWFHHPDISPAHAQGAWQMLARDLHPGYNAAAAQSSQRRAEVQKVIARAIDTGNAPEKISMVAWNTRDDATS